MSFKQRLDEFHHDVKEYVDHYEKLAKEVATGPGVMGEPVPRDVLQRVLLECSAASAAIAHLQETLKPSVEKIRELEKNARDNLLPKLAGAAKKWDAHHAAAEQAAAILARLADLARPLTTRQFKASGALPNLLTASHHPRAAALAPLVKETLAKVNEAVYRSDITLQLNDFSSLISRHLSMV